MGHILNFATTMWLSSQAVYVKKTRLIVRLFYISKRVRIRLTSSSCMRFWRN